VTAQNGLKCLHGCEKLRKITSSDDHYVDIALGIIGVSRN
jgi:hypothetical protein